MNLFHLAIPVSDLDAANDFYSNVLGCSKGRSSTKWIDFNFYGHQLVCCLLYTSPSPRDATLSRMPSSA